MAVMIVDLMAVIMAVMIVDSMAMMMVESML